MMRSGVAALVLVAIAGCDFDRRLEYSIRYPATLVVVNGTSGPLTIEEVYSTPDSSSLFSISGGVLETRGAQWRADVSEGVAAAVVKGDFRIMARCDRGPTKDLHGDTLQRVEQRDTGQWRVSILVAGCDQ
jgi:hypothetical protein